MTKFAKSKAGSFLYKKASGEKEQKMLATALPLVETAVVTTVRVATTEKQNLSRREKNTIERQDLIPAVIGIASGSYLNKKAFGLAEDIGKKLDSKKVKDIDKITNATKVLTPIFTTCVLLRLVTPTISAFVSGEIEEKKAKKNLDVKV